MNMTVYAHELDRDVEYPRPPDYYSNSAKVAWERGVAARCALSSRENPYRVRYMRRAWIDGWDAAGSAIRRAQESK